MLAAISPSHLHYDETLNTLQYVYRAKQIVNKVTMSSSQHDAIVEKLTKELAKMEEKLKESVSNNTCIDYESLKQLTLQITERKGLLTNLTTTWEDRVALAKQLQLQTIDKYKQHINTLKSQLHLPFLVDTREFDINRDLIYYLPIGTTEAAVCIHNQLSCHFIYDEQGVWLLPTKSINDSHILINELLVAEKQLLSHGDKITFYDKNGDVVHFKFKMPIFAMK